MDNKNRGFGPVLVGGRNVNKNLSFFSHLLLFRFQCGIVAPEDFAVGQAHLELKGFAFGVAPICEIGIDLVLGTDRVLAFPFGAGVLLVRFGCLSAMGEKADKANGSKTASAE